MTNIQDNWAKIILIILSLINLALIVLNVNDSFLPDTLTFDHMISLLIPVILFPRLEFLQIAPVFKEPKNKTIDYLFLALFSLSYIIYLVKMTTLLFQ